MIKWADIEGTHGQNGWRHVFPADNPAPFNSMANHKFNISHKIINTVDPADDDNFDQANENDRDRGRVPIEQLQPIHSALQNAEEIFIEIRLQHIREDLARVMNIVEAHHNVKQVKNVTHPFDLRKCGYSSSSAEMMASSWTNWNRYVENY